MNIHKNARLTAQGRLLLVLRVEELGWRMVEAAKAARHIAAARLSGSGANTQHEEALLASLCRLQAQSTAFQTSGAAWP